MRKHVMNFERVPATGVSVSAEVFANLSDIFNSWPSHPHRPLKSRTAARAFCVCSKSERLRNAALAAAHVRDGLRQYLSKGRRSGQRVALGLCERFLSPSHATNPQAAASTDRHLQNAVEKYIYCSCYIPDLCTKFPFILSRPTRILFHSKVVACSGEFQYNLYSACSTYLWAHW